MGARVLILPRWTSAVCVNKNIYINTDTRNVNTKPAVLVIVVVLVGKGKVPPLALLALLSLLLLLLLLEGGCNPTDQSFMTDLVLHSVGLVLKQLTSLFSPLW